MAIGVAERKLIETIENKEVPQVYANGITIAGNPGDTVLIFHLGAADVAIVWMSNVVAKTLLGSLSRQIAVNEAILGAPIPTLTELDELRAAYELRKANDG